MIFKAWLVSQMKRVDAVGDLAREVRKDQTWPPTQDLVKLRQHMRKRGAVEKALAALDEAYGEYQKRGDKQRPFGIG
jgi:uncharacterized protein YozE (UPF0346 family)